MLRKHLIFRGTALLPLLLFALLSGCSSQKKVQRFFDNQLGPEGSAGEFTGLLMVDAESGDTLVSLNAGRYFTPASTTKVFTLYSALKTLPARLPALKYQVRGDTLHVLGTGDPSAFHPVLGDRTAVDFIDSYRHVVLYPATLEDPPWGPGWAWDDYDRYYMVERSALPVYGNVLRVIREGGDARVTPHMFRDSLLSEIRDVRRAPEANRFYDSPPFRDTLEIPLKLSPGLTLALWEEASGRTLIRGKNLPTGPWQVLPGMASDSLYREMMAVSDNFLAEQLMLLVSGTLADSLSFSRARDYILGTYLKDMPSPPRWVDGSGLSRYNLASPESLVYVLRELYREIPEERLFALMARGGEKGTLQDLYRNPDGPFLFGKTGTLSNNHNLCGYLRTKSGRTVVFSFMNNHYLKPTRLIQARMQRLLLWVRDNY